MIISKKSSWQFVVPVLLGMLFGICTFASYNNGQVSFLAPSLYFLMVLFAVLFCTVFILFERYLSEDGNVYHSRRFDEPWPCHNAVGLFLRRVLPLKWSIKNVALSSGIILVFWLPYIVLAYPGIYWWDTTLQIAEFFSVPRVLWDQHPFMDSIVFGFFAKIGIRCWGNAFAGLYMFIILQCVAAAIALAMVAIALSDYSVSWFWRITCLLFFAIWPAYPRMFTTVAKDTVFSPILVIFVIMFCSLMKSQGEKIRQWRFSLPFLLVCIGMCVTRKTGVYIVLGSMILLVFSKFAAKIKAWCVAFGVAVFLLCSVAIPAVAYPTLHILPGLKQDAWSLPIQQLANAVVQNPDSFSDHEKEIIQQYYAQDIPTLEKNYSFVAADPVKGPVTMNGQQEFVSIWATHFFTNQQEYMSAFAGLAAGWFSFPIPAQSIYDINAYINIPYNSEHHYEGIEPLPRWSSHTLGEKTIPHLETIVTQIPIINVLSSKALWGSILPFLCLFLVLRKRSDKRSNAVCCLMPLLLTVATLYVGPTSLYQEGTRYVFPILCAMPLWLAISIKSIDPGDDIS
ncbi:hypothetical protein JS530_09060 [Bifidobacterium sp. LC6]|uniref:Glycosyltransferase RgtA/B/C/D-like domain-containing protein n=1 Tax=Bifidobacterium colobi TaxID=2809026 RepID=A0ABS5UX04_9BIFI|nr:DUF6020 family protein [Bifidobacterium colobi]MBT1175642.1 hypothetical protein [Bifidobacterium colobi]